MLLTARTMKDSFLLQLGEGKQGPELSFEEYERTERGKANRSLAVQISRENDRLKGLLERSGKQGDRGRGKAHCQGCDFLLSRGLSTTRCRLAF